jgi:hypothetical protein
MAVFVSFSDESSGKSERDTFMFAGWIGPEEDWARFFTPAWDERVLAGPPRIPYLHMTEIRSPKWRQENGLTETDAERRIDEACVLLDQLANLQPIRMVMNGGDFRDAFDETMVRSIKRKQFAASKFEPDYSCFLGYAWAALKYLAEYHPESEKLDFVVERKNKVTNYIQEFHSQLPQALAALGSPELARLVGELVPAGKDRLPLHAADLLCWHCARREKLKTMSHRDKLRYKTIAYRKGVRIEFSKDLIAQLKTAVLPKP